MEWVAGFPWTEWQPSHGLGGNLPMDWVADIRGICNRIGVFMMQNGPGAENGFGGVAQAYAESVPILLLPAGMAR